MLWSQAISAECMTPELEQELITNAKVEIGIFGNWAAYEDIEPHQCWVIGKPAQSRVKKILGDKEFCRSASFIYVLYVPERLGSPQPSIKFGYNVKNSSLPTLIGPEKLYQFPITSGEYAWARNTSEDLSIIKSLFEMDSMTIRGLSESGYSVVDQYLMRGFSEANLLARNACNAYPIS